MADSVLPLVKKEGDIGNNINNNFLHITVVVNFS
jgi:hypothetical protein